MAQLILQRCWRGCSSSLQQWPRTFVNHAAQQQPPAATERIADAKSFLTSIGRSAETKVKVEEWGELWKLNGHALKEQGLGAQDRRYVLWAMEKFRQGEDPIKFAHEVKPKKKIRGRGPAVQNGKRIRSRRKQ